MSNNADVRSLAQLESLRERLVLWRGATLKESELLLVELQKLSSWLNDEADRYWRQQLVNAQRSLNEAQEALLRCEAAVRADEKRPCTEERKRVEKTKLRRGLCDKKLRLVADAKLAWSRQLNKIRGRLQSVSDMAESDMQVAIAKLTKIIETLQTYAHLTLASLPSDMDGLDSPPNNSPDDSHQASKLPGDDSNHATPDRPDASSNLPE